MESVVPLAANPRADYRLCIGSSRQFILDFIWRRALGVYSLAIGHLGCLLGLATGLARTNHLLPNVPIQHSLYGVLGFPTPSIQALIRGSARDLCRRYLGGHF